MVKLGSGETMVMKVCARRVQIVYEREGGSCMEKEKKWVVWCLGILGRGGCAWRKTWMCT